MEVVDDDDGDDMKMEVVEEVVSFGLLFGRTESVVVGVIDVDGGTTNDWAGWSNAAAAITTEDNNIVILIVS